MSPLQLHLATNHFPVIGLFFTLFMAGLTLWRFKPDYLKITYGFAIFCAVMGFITHVFGEEAHHAYPKDTAESLWQAVENHEEAAELAVALMNVMGLGAIAALILDRYQKGNARIILAVWSGYVLAVVYFVGQAAHLGGVIHHQL